MSWLCFVFRESEDLGISIPRISKVNSSKRRTPFLLYLFIFFDLVNNLLWERICRYCKVGWKRYGNLSGEKVCYGVIVLWEEVTDDDGKREVVLSVQVGQLRKSLFQLAVDVAENNAVTCQFTFRLRYKQKASIRGELGGGLKRLLTSLRPLLSWHNSWASLKSKQKWCCCRNAEVF